MVDKFKLFVDMLEKYGVIKISFAVLLFGIYSFIFYFLFNPNSVFERYDQYARKKFAESTDVRMESSPIIKSYLNQMSFELNAKRTFVGEFHNGKHNPTGMQWQYFDVTFTNDDGYDIFDEYQNVPLVKYAIIEKVYRENIWVGTLQDLKAIDNRFALRLESNGVGYIGLIRLYGEYNDIGIMGVTFDSYNENLDPLYIMSKLYKYSSKIEPLLDSSRN